MRTAAAACLAVFLIGCSGLFPCLLTLLAYADGEHGVLASCSDGRFQLVLTHPNSTQGFGNPNCCESPLHQHSLAAKLICSLAAPKGMEPDHFLDFVTAFQCEEDNDDDLIRHSDQTANTLSWLAGFDFVSEISLVPRMNNVSWRPLPEPSSTSPPSPFFVRTTVLLI